MGRGGSLATDSICAYIVFEVEHAKHPRAEPSQHVETPGALCVVLSAVAAGLERK